VAPDTVPWDSAVAWAAAYRGCTTPGAVGGPRVSCPVPIEPVYPFLWPSQANGPCSDPAGGDCPYACPSRPPLLQGAATDDNVPSCNSQLALHPGDMQQEVTASM
jgi:hypothetical protein